MLGAGQCLQARHDFRHDFAPRTWLENRLCFVIEPCQGSVKGLEQPGVSLDADQRWWADRLIDHAIDLPICHICNVRSMRGHDESIHNNLPVVRNVYHCPQNRQEDLHMELDLGEVVLLKGPAMRQFRLNDHAPGSPTLTPHPAAP